MKFNIFQSNDQWYWNLQSANGKIVCQSEGYKRKAGALKGIAATCKANSKTPIVEK